MPLNITDSYGETVTIPMMHEQDASTVPMMHEQDAVSLSVLDGGGSVVINGALASGEGGAVAISAALPILRAGRYFHLTVSVSSDAIGADLHSRSFAAGVSLTASAKARAVHLRAIAGITALSSDTIGAALHARQVEGAAILSSDAQARAINLRSLAGLAELSTETTACAIHLRQAVGTASLSSDTAARAIHLRQIGGGASMLAQIGGTVKYTVGGVYPALIADFTDQTYLVSEYAQYSEADKFPNLIADFTEQKYALEA